MGHTNQTTNLHLPQFIGSDKPTWLSDINGAFLAIDNAYGTIETDSAAAVTAAGNAVTTANAANTTAGNASTAAASASSQASQALTAANNAAYTANQADAKANRALGELLGEVTADGIKTKSQLLDELFAQLDLTKLTRNSVLVDPYDFIFSLNHGGTELLYVCTRVSADSVIMESNMVQANGSTNIAATVTAGGVSFSNNTSTVPASGRTFKIYS